MKNVIFLTPYFLPRLGGVEKHVSELAKVLFKKGYKVTILTMQVDSTDSLNEKFPYCSVIRIPLDQQRNKFTLWRWIKNYFDNRKESEIIHVHDVGWWLLIQAIVYKKNNFFITFHGWEGTLPIRWQAKLHRLLISKISKGSIHVGAFIQHYYWDKPNKITYGGTQLSPYVRPQSLSKEITIVFLGRLEKENDIELYLLVLAALAKNQIKVKMTWVGDGSFKTVCEMWGSVTGMISDTQAYVKEADFVFASSYLSILESQAAGKVVCAVYNSPLKKLYLHTYPGKDSMIISNKPEEIAISIEQLIIASSKYKKLSENSYHFAQTNSWNEVADVYEALWNKPQ